MSHQNQEMHEEVEEEEEVAPFWMISFSDMMTLLLTFFIMLYTISTLNATKAREVSQAMQHQFGYSPNMYSPLPGSRFDNSPDQSGNQETEGLPNPRQALRAHSAYELAAIGFVLFEPGSDELTLSNREAIARVLPSLIGTRQKIELRGHSTPKESKSYYRELMDLSYARAYKVRSFLIDSGVKPELIEIKLLPPNSSLTNGNEEFISGMNSSVEICHISR